jgi:hypothetical protein
MLNETLSERMKKNNPMYNLEIRKKMINTKTGKPLSEEHKKNISKSLKNFYKKNIFWSEGLTKETDSRIKKISESLKGKLSNKKGKTFEEFYGKEKAREIKEKMNISFKKKILSEECKEKIKKNNCRFWLGKKRDEETKKLISATKQGIDIKDWKKFTSFEPYNEKFNNKFRRMIRKRDNQICMLCRIHREKLSRALCVHHINYDKLLTIPENCISLCIPCHVKTNINKKYWIGFFQSLLSEKYGYEYSKDNKIILELKNE